MKVVTRMRLDLEGLVQFNLSHIKNMYASCRKDQKA